MANAICNFNRLRVYLKRSGWSDHVHRATTGFTGVERTWGGAFARIIGLSGTTMHTGMGFIAAYCTVCGAGIRGMQWT